MRPVVYAMFFTSGAASLIYQTIWIRKFSFVLGGTVFSMSIVIATFMAGLAVGAAVLGRLSDRVRSPMKLYALIEIAIGASAIILDQTDGLRARMVAKAIDTPNLEGTLAMRAAIAVVWLGIPCFLVGGTVPVMVRFLVRRLSALGREVGALYFVNTLGAAFGALLTGTILVELLGFTGCTILAASANGVVALAALAIGRLGDGQAAAENEAKEEPAEGSLLAPAIAFFLSGFCSLVLEMGFTRLILGFLPSGALVVSMNLFLLLLGLAIGGVIGGRLVDASESPRRLAGLLFALTGFFALLGLGSVDTLGHLKAINYVPRVPHIAAVLALVFPAALGMGATFPALARVLVTSQRRIGSQLGGYYALNTLGAVAGGLAAPFVLIPIFGTSVTVLVGAVLQLGIAALLAWSAPRASDPMVRFAAPAVIVLGALLVPVRWDVYHATLRSAAAREFPDWSRERAYIEGADSTVILYQADESGQSEQADENQFRIQVNASTLVAFDTNETKLMAHLPLMAAEDPKRALVICFGMGNTFRSALAHDIEVDVVDINPAIPGLARIHQRDPSKTFGDPKGKIYINDGRNYLEVTRRTYDMITLDPAPPVWAVGVGNIQSREFYQLISDRLTDTGVAEAWMLSSLEGDFLLTLAAWRAVFPHVAVFRGGWYSAFHVLGSRSPIRFRDASMRRLFTEPRLRADLGEIDSRVFSPEFIRELYVTDENGVDQVIMNKRALTDDWPVLEYRMLRGLSPERYTFPKSVAQPFPSAR